MPYGKLEQQIKSVQVASLLVADRFVNPTEPEIAAMAKSLEEYGQITPIIITPITMTTYKVVAGATRVKAASRLGQAKLDARIFRGSADDCRIYELVENLDRRNIDGEKRKKVKAELKRLIAERAKQAAPCKGGRGKKGGLRQVARELGVSERTTRRAKNKLRQNAGSAAVSKSPEPSPRQGPKQYPVIHVDEFGDTAIERAPATKHPGEPVEANVPPSMRGTGLTKLAITWTPNEDARFERYRLDNKAGDRSHTARRIINEFLDTNDAINNCRSVPASRS